MPLLDDHFERPKKKLKFHCANCGAEIVTIYLQPGDILICKSCGKETAVPASSSGTDEEPTYRKFITKAVAQAAVDNAVVEVSDQPTPWGLVSVLKYYGVVILFTFTMTCLAAFIFGIKYGFQEAAMPDSPLPAPDYSTLQDSIVLNIIGTFIGWTFSIYLIYYIVVKRHNNEFFKALHIFPVSSAIIVKYGKIAIITVSVVLVLGFVIYYSPLNKFVPDELPIDKYLTGGYRQLILFSILAILAPFPEELLFRGFLYKGLAHSVGKMASAIIVTLLFTLGHAGQLGFSVLNLGLIAMVGTVLIVIRIKTDSLTKCIIVHQLYNIALIIIMWISIIVFGSESLTS